MPASKHMPYISYIFFLVFSWLLAFFGGSVVRHPSVLACGDFSVSRSRVLGFFFCLTSFFACAYSAMNLQEMSEQLWAAHLKVYPTLLCLTVWTIVLVAGTRFQSGPVTFRYFSLVIATCAVLWWVTHDASLSWDDSLLLAGIAGLTATTLLADFRSRKRKPRDLQ